VLILGIETSCDETAAAVVVSGQRVRSNVVASQIARHQAYGGVVPELAARGHLTAILPVVQTALDDAGIGRREIDGVAVTEGPGLAGSLLVGLNAAKAIAYGLDRPLIGVNHLEAHVYANWLSQPNEPPPLPPPFPLVCLLVSGGHSELILMTGHGHYRHLGRTLDDAAGEAFDKGARLLGLGYPGGPAVETAAAGGDPTRFDLPRAWLGDGYDFSFSGVKTALLRAVAAYRLPDAPADPPAAGGPAGPFREHTPPRLAAEMPVADLAASFQAAIVEPLVVKTVRAAGAFAARAVLLAGGVAANRALRDVLAARVREELGDGVQFRSPPFAYCTDNAAMIAGAANWALRRGAQIGWEADITPRLQLPTTTT